MPEALERSRSSASHRPALVVQLRDEADFLQARQRAKQMAVLLGFELQDQTRIATAVSEIARNAWEYGGGGTAEFFVDRAPGTPQMRVVVTDQGPGMPGQAASQAGRQPSGGSVGQGLGLGLPGARRLMDGMEIESAPGRTVVTLWKRLPRHAPPPPTEPELAAELARTAGSEANVLQEQNRELQALLLELRSRETELQVLNEELQETNRGVLVLYSELEDKARAVQEAAELKSRFLSGVTHELRTPLNSIVSLSRLLLAHTDGPLTSEQDKQVHFIQRSAQNMTELVNDLLDAARLEAGRASVRISRFTLAELFAGLRGMFRPLAINPDVRLLLEVPDETVQLETDEGKLAQILRNLISNALKFTERGSVRVSVELGPTPREIGFVVQDTGVGIAPEHRDLVMQEWGQVPAGAKAARDGAPVLQRGSGLGLPLSRSLAELLGGRLEFESVLGKGSTFRVILPARVPEEVSATPEAADTNAGSILMFEQDEVEGYLLRRVLARLTAAAVVQTADRITALESIRSARPTLFLACSGEESTAQLLALARQVRAQAGVDAAGEPLPVAVYTARPFSPEERATLEEASILLIERVPHGADPADTEAGEMELERALLSVGLSNLHGGHAAA